MSTKPVIAELCRAYYLGVKEYNEAMCLQERLVKARISQQIPDSILFLQHPSVLTIGASGREENIITPRNVLAEEGVEIVYTDRGGDITVHEPGQLVGYPVFDLSTKGKDLHQYVRNLEEVVIRTLGEYSITARRLPCYTGVWVGDEKICAIGIRVSKWVTKHGFALNVNNGLKCFSYIHPCGITDKGVTSMSRLLEHDVSIDDIILHIIEHCSQVFKLDTELLGHPEFT